MLAHKDDLARSRAHRRFVPRPIRLEPCGNVPRARLADLSARDELLHGFVEAIAGDAGRRHQAASVQAHVAFLYAAGGERAQRREILCEPDRRHQFRQFHGRFDARDSEPQRSRGVRGERAADGADFQRDPDLAHELPAAADAPARQRPVLPIGTRIGVRAGFDRPPVVAGRNRDRVDAVHDALVVGSRSIRVRGGDVARHHDSVTDDRAVEFVDGQLFGPVTDAPCHEGAIGEIRQDAHCNGAAADPGDARGHRLADRVDQVGAHGVPGVDEQVHRERSVAAGQ